MGGPAVLWAALQDGALKMTPPPWGHGPPWTPGTRGGPASSRTRQG